MKRLKIMIRVFRETGADTLIGIYLGFFLLCELIFWIVEPGISTYWDALWYCFTVASTVGFGDIVVATRVSRILSMVLSLYSAVTLAIFTGVFVNYFNQLVQLRQKDSLAALADKTDRLPDMSRDELKKLSAQIKQRIAHKP